jgi:predicted nucleotide-binding protein
MTVFIDYERERIQGCSTTEGWTNMNKDEVNSLLVGAGIRVGEESRNGNDNGWRLVCGGGAIVMLYDTGKLVVQGKNQEPVKRALGLEGEPAAVARPAQPFRGRAPARKVFVVYGHDQAARTELEAMLRRWGLEPLIFDQIKSGGQTIIEKLETVRAEADFAVVLATTDDEGHWTEHPEEKGYRARQNVVLELGMMLAILGRPKVAVLLKSDVHMERPSDIQGLIYISYKDNVSEAALTLAKEIHGQGMPIDLDRV